MSVVFSLLLVCSWGTLAFASELKVALVGGLQSFDPHKANSATSAAVLNQVYNFLVTLGDDGKVKGDLAESWEMTDDYTWIFHLKKGVKFHNGEEFTARDVKFTIERMQDPSTGYIGTILRGKEIESVEVIDTYTVQLKTRIPFQPLLFGLTRHELGMLNEKATLAAGSEYGKNPVGTGPFKFVEWVRGDHITLEKHSDYFGGSPKIDRVTFRVIPESATRTVELESGGIDLLFDQLPPQDFDRLKTNKDITLYEGPGPSSHMLGFNVSVFPDKRVRQALNYAVDKHAMVDTLFFGKAEVARGPMSRSIVGFDKTLPEAYPYHPEKARALLKEAGYESGLKITLFTDPRTDRKEVCEFVQACLIDVGVEAKVETMEWSTFLATTSKGVEGLYLLSIFGTGDADGALHPCYHSSNIGSSNRHHWSNHEIDDLLTKGRSTMDPEKNQEIYDILQRKIVEEAPQIFLVVPRYLGASRANVKGFKLSPNTCRPFVNISIDE